MKTRTLAAFAALAVCVTATATAAHAQVPDLKFDMEGYYRTRSVYLTNLAAEPAYQIVHPTLGVPIDMPAITRTSYLMQRLRLNPKVSYQKLATLYMQIDAFDDVVWGDNNAKNIAPLFATTPSNQSYLGGTEEPSINMTRAWMEFQIPVGVMRVGRMPSHWGLGLLSNGGGSGNNDPLVPAGKPKRHIADYYFANDFGDSHFGATVDRILFATKPLQIVKTIMKDPDPSSNFILAYAYDKISEAPYLYFDPTRRYRPYGQQGFLSRGDPDDDVNEHVIVAAYSDPDWDQVRYTDELKGGAYVVLRDQAQSFTAPNLGPPNTPATCAGLPDPQDCVTSDEGSFVWIADLWYRIRYGEFYSEAEGYHIGGHTTGGIPFPGNNLRHTANINAGVARAGYMDDDVDAILEIGYSSGDDNLTDREFKQRPIDPDYNVGLILFPEVIRERSARVFGPPFISAAYPDGARPFMTDGGVTDAKYLLPKVRYRPGLAGLEVVAQGLFAWVDKWSDAPNIFVCPVPGVAAKDCKASKYLGTEIDLAVKSKFAGDHMSLSLETGYLRFGDVLKTGSDQSGRRVVNAPDGSFTFQARIAYLF